MTHINEEEEEQSVHCLLALSSVRAPAKVHVFMGQAELGTPAQPRDHRRETITPQPPRHEGDPRLQQVPRAARNRDTLTGTGARGHVLMTRTRTR